MKKQGFTLAELLGVIVIISLLLLLIIPLIINGVKNREADVAEVNNNIIFEAVGEYMDLDKEKYPNIPGNVYCISLKELIDSGKLVDPVKKLVEEGNYSTDFTIEVRISSNGVKKYSATTKEECKTYTSKKIGIVVEPGNNTWSTKKTVTIYYPDLGDGYKHEYKINDGAWQTTPDKEIILNFDADGKVEARMTGKSELEAKSKVEKIDTFNPIVKKTSPSSWNMNYEQQIDITLTDAHSGIGGYCVKTDTTKPSADDECFETVRFPAYGGTGTVSVFKPEGTYYIFAKDRVGNVSDYDSNNPNLTFTVKDDTPPTCTITAEGTMGVNDWYISNVNVTLNPQDEDSGIRTYDLTTVDTPSYNNIGEIILDTDTESITYYGYVEDRAGNKNENPCTLTIKRDATGPVYQSGGSVSKGSVTAATFIDEMSGMNKVEYIFQASNTTPSVNAAWSTSRSGTTACGKTIYVYTKATDNASNYTIRYLGTYSTGSCIPAGTCNIRGNTIRYPGYSWTCSRGHSHTNAYTHYCTDGNGTLYTRDTNPGLVTYKWVCPTNPYGPADGWTVIND